MKLLKRQTNTNRTAYATFVHILLVSALPLLVYVLVRLDFAWIALLFILLSKWRMFAVKARHWPANVRANAVDITVGVSVVAFMFLADTQAVQLLWAALHAVWLLVIKPQSGALWTGIQALISQSVALIALFLFWSEASTLLLVVATWVVCYFSARHFLTAFDETMSRTTAYAWAFFGASTAWLASRWLIFYGPIAQPALVLSVLGYGLAAMYYLQHTDRLSKNIKLQFIGVMSGIILFLIIFSDWSDKTI